jgi:hypothetical protein
MYSLNYGDFHGVGNTTHIPLILDYGKPERMTVPEESEGR